MSLKLPNTMDTWMNLDLGSVVVTKCFESTNFFFLWRVIFLIKCSRFLKKTRIVYFVRPNPIHKWSKPKNKNYKFPPHLQNYKKKKLSPLIHCSNVDIKFQVIAIAPVWFSHLFQSFFFYFIFSNHIFKKWYFQPPFFSPENKRNCNMCEYLLNAYRYKFI